MADKPRKKRLKSVEDVRRYLADLINATRTGTVDPAMASRLGYLLNILRACIVDGELEKRVAEIERKLIERS